MELILFTLFVLVCIVGYACFIIINGGYEWILNPKYIPLRRRLEFAVRWHHCNMIGKSMIVVLYGVGTIITVSACIIALYNLFW